MGIKAAIVGGTGYAGVELLRILVRHPGADIEVVTSRGDAGQRISDVFPNLEGIVEGSFVAPEPEVLASCDVVFFATPHGVAMEMAPGLVEAGCRVIDLGADFRIRDIAVWEKWYGLSHTCPDLVGQAVYGLPEYSREAIRDALLVACPGCYPTAIELGFKPLLEKGLVDTGFLVADAKSGASGAGRQAAIHTLLTETSGSFRAYAASGHRHLPEIRQELALYAGKEVDVTFVPHLAPMIRGIEASLYSRLEPDVSLETIQEVFEDAYRHEPFVTVLAAGSHPQTRAVRGANNCQIALHKPEGGSTLVVLSVIDNLVKGAAGQAVQNMNLMFGLEETLGLEHVALLP